MRYLVRQPDLGHEWEDAVAVSALSATYAAEEYAQHRCQQDAERYSSYESGVFVEVKDLDTGEVLDVSVTMRLNPTFHGTEHKSSQRR